MLHRCVGYHGRSGQPEPSGPLDVGKGRKATPGLHCPVLAAATTDYLKCQGSRPCDRTHLIPANQPLLELELEAPTGSETKSDSVYSWFRVQRCPKSAWNRHSTWGSGKASYREAETRRAAESVWWVGRQRIGAEFQAEEQRTGGLEMRAHAPRHPPPTQSPHPH